MKVLLCSPYLKSQGIFRGGLNFWANNILSYNNKIDSDVEIYPISFDRRHYVSVDSNKIRRIILGIKEFSSAMHCAIQKMKILHPDVVHIATSGSLSLFRDILLVYAAKKHCVKSVVHFHFGRIPELYHHKNWEWRLLKRVVEAADVIVTMDQPSYKTLFSLQYNKIYCCPNPVSIDIVEHIQIEKDSIQRIPGKILFVGHVLLSKGVIELVNACKHLEGIELHIVGKAEEPVISELFRIASEKDGGSWLKMRGELPHEEVLKEMMSASVFVLPSYTEGFPNVILEAMVCGCPIVSTTVGAIPEILNIEKGFNYGICIEPKNIQALVDAISQMLSDTNFATRCAESAKSRVNELYASPVVWNRLTEIWSNA